MNYFLNGVVRAVAESFDLPGPVVEIGSYQVEGQEEIANLRGLFPGKEFIGIDMREGPGVDLVASVEDLPLADASVGTVLALSTFEHVQRFWLGFDEIRRVLRPDGVLLVACPFFFRIHQFPDDYWRFTPAALEMMLEPYAQKIIGSHGARNRPANVWALACRENYPRINARQYERYQQRLHDYASEPQSLSRKFRYHIARLLCGRGPFAPYLDENKWKSQWLTSKTV